MRRCSGSKASWRRGAGASRHGCGRSRAGIGIRETEFTFTSNKKGCKKEVFLMNIALLVLRLVPGLLFMGHGLQKLVPPKAAPKFLAANGPRGTGGFFEQIGMRPGLLLAVVAGLGELAGGFLIAAGLLTPLGTALIGAVMTVAILRI